MIINFSNIGSGQGGGSGSGVTPEDVQRQIDSALTPYWESAQTESAITEAVSGLATEEYVDEATADFITSAYTGFALAEDVEDFERVTASALTELHDQIVEIDEVIPAAIVDLNEKIAEISGETPDLSDYWTSAQTESAITEAIKDLASEEYVDSAIEEAISGISFDTNILMAVDALPESANTGDVIAYNEPHTTPEPGYKVISLNTSELASSYPSQMFFFGTEEEVVAVIGYWGEGSADMSMVGLGSGYLRHTVFSLDNIFKWGVLTPEDFVAEAGTFPWPVEDFYRQIPSTPTTIDTQTSVGVITAWTEGDVIKIKVPEAQVMGYLSGIDETPVAVDTSFVYHTESPAGTTTYVQKVMQYTGTGWVEVSPDLSAYTPTSGFATVNGSAITNGGNIVIQGGGGDMSAYWTSAETKTYVDSAITGVQDQLDTIDEVIPAAIVDINNRMVSSTSVSTIWRGTQTEYDDITTKDPNTLYIIVNE